MILKLFYTGTSLACVTWQWVSDSKLRLVQGAGLGAEPRHEESREKTLSWARDTLRLSSCDLRC